MVGEKLSRVITPPHVNEGVGDDTSIKIAQKNGASRIRTEDPLHG